MLMQGISDADAGRPKVTGQTARGKTTTPISQGLTAEQQKLVNKIHQWAYTDPKKNPKKFAKLFNEIWAHRLHGRI